MTAPTNAVLAVTCVNKSRPKIWNIVPILTLFVYVFPKISQVSRIPAKSSDTRIQIPHPLQADLYSSLSRKAVSKERNKVGVECIGVLLVPVMWIEQFSIGQFRYFKIQLKTILKSPRGSGE